MIFAVATKSSVYLYDTQQQMPFGLISNIHYTRLTDLTWSSDGTILIVSSTDGFCTLITFADEELGEIYVKPAEEPKVVQTNDNDVSKSEEQSKNEKLLNSDLVAKPIAFRRKPKDSVKENNQNVSKDEGEEAINDKIPTPIAFRRKPKDVPANDKEPTNQQTIDEKPTPIAFRRKPKGDVILVCEKPLEKKLKEAVIEVPATIISSEEKFVSPEKTIVKPATPIQVRREPRKKLDTPTTNEANAFNIMTLIKSPNMDANMIPVSPIPSTPPTQQSQKRSSSKKATPIAVRRHRKLIVSPPSAKPNAKDAEEEALDAWPIDEPRPSSISMDIVVVEDDVAGCSDTTKPVSKNAEIFAMDIEATEDIRLVYDGESQEDDQAKEDTEIVSEHVTPNSKTPRRVQLRTISTPKSKSKKKL